jgi:hypothetical protein
MCILCCENSLLMKCQQPKLSRNMVAVGEPVAGKSLSINY